MLSRHSCPKTRYCGIICSEDQINKNKMSGEDQNKSALLLPILRKIPLFIDLDETIHKEIIEHIVLMYYPANYTIFKQDDQGDALYIVKSGTVEISKKGAEEGDLPIDVADIVDNGFFGEMALVSNTLRNATAKTTTECEIFILSKEDFQKLLDTNKTLAEHISATVIARLKQNNKLEE